jgi:GT2 family glycosyltransferase
MSEHRMNVLIGIVTKNRANILPKAIASAVAQEGLKLQVSVIDDGSTDTTLSLPAKFSTVCWIRRNVSLGYMTARNELMKSDNLDYFVSLDDDAWFLEGDEIAVAIDYLENNRSVGAVAFDILSPDRPEAMPRIKPQPAAMFIGCGHVLRLAAIRQVGFYELTPGSYGGEEKDLCLRLMDAGFQIVRLPGVHVWHDKTPVARHIPAQHVSGVCNDLVMTLRRAPLILLPMAIMAKFYRHFCHSRRHQLARPCLKGFSLFIRSIPVVLRTRKPVRIQTLRKFIRLSRA